MRALWFEFESRALKVENNRISATTRACLFNSHNFDFVRLRCLLPSSCKAVHRVDGPISIYRGWDNGADRRIWELNQELADATIFQSNYSLRKHEELGLGFRSPCVIMNSVDARIFNPHGRVVFDRKRKIRLISTSWSDNPNKGASVYKYLDDHLDWKRFEYMFVGRSPTSFRHIRALAPVPSQELANLLRQNDIYVIASRNDPCSNALLEALSCGLPALFLNSGGHPEIAREGGFGFDLQEQVPDLLDQLVDKYEQIQARIGVPTLAEIADRYLTVMEISKRESP